MKNKKRAQRRADSENLVKRYTKAFRAWRCKDPASARAMARKLRDHPQSCSCNMCCNQRHYATAKPKEKLTRQERVQDVREREALA